MNFDFDLERLARSPFAIGAVGSLVALRFVPGESWLGRVGHVLAGGACAGYAAPAMAEWLSLSSPGLQSGLSFAVGLFGLSLIAAVIQGIKEVRVGEIITGWISRKK